VAQIEKFTYSKNAILFDLQRKITKLIADKLFPNSGVTRRLIYCGRLAVLIDARRYYSHVSSFCLSRSETGALFV